MGKDAKKVTVSDEWREKDVEERLSYSLIKVRGQLQKFQFERFFKHILD